MPALALVVAHLERSCGVAQGREDPAQPRGLRIFKDHGSHVLSLRSLRRQLQNSTRRPRETDARWTLSFDHIGSRAHPARIALTFVALRGVPSRSFIPEFPESLRLLIETEDGVSGFFRTFGVLPGQNQMIASGLQRNDHVGIKRSV